MGSVFSRGNSWVIEYRINGRVKRETIGKKGIVTKTIAREILNRREQEIKLGQYEIVNTKVPTISEFKNDYIQYIRDIKMNRSWKLEIPKLRRLQGFFKERRLSEISSKDIDDYKFMRLKDVKPSTVNRELACLSHLFNTAKRQNKFFGENPVTIAKLLPEHNQIERILSPYEETVLLNSSSLELVAIIKCALNTGMRKNEILTLKWDNVDLEGGIIKLEHTNTKSKKTRRIPINTQLRKLLLEQKLKVGEADHVFLNSNRTAYKRHDSLNQAFRGACVRANIKDLRFHDLRHTAATRMIEAGASIVAVSRILGHADLKTTMRYAHPEGSLKDAVETLSKSFSGSFTDKSTDIGE